MPRTKNPYGRNGQAGQKKCTPRWFIDQLCASGYHITLDVCADEENSVAPVWYDEQQDGLKQPWDLPVGEGWNWCNPPFGNVEPWIEKAIGQAQWSGSRTLMLLPCTPGVGWFRKWHGYASKIWLVVPRLNFWNPLTQQLESGVTYNSCLWEITPASATESNYFTTVLYMHYLEAHKPKDAKR